MGTESDRLAKIEEDLKATADDLAADAARIREIETRKTELPASAPETAALAEEGETLIEQMADKAKVQSALVEQAQAEPEGAA